MIDRIVFIAEVVMCTSYVVFLFALAASIEALNNLRYEWDNLAHKKAFNACWVALKVSGLACILSLLAIIATSIIDAVSK